MKTRGKSNIFKCLRPATADDGLFKQSKPYGGYDVPDYSSGSEHGGAAAAGNPKLLRFFSMRKAEQSSDESSDDPNIRKGKSRGKFRRVLKAVFFEASLVRKLRKSDTFMGLFRSRSSSSTMSSKSQKMSRNESFSSSRGLTETDKISRMNSDSSSRLSASSSFMTARDMSSPCSNCSLSRSTSEVQRQLSPASYYLDRNRTIISKSRTKQNNIIGRGRYCSKVGYCCLILCLLSLVFWGKALAIVCISAWLYFAPLCFDAATVTPPPEFEPANECRVMTNNQFRHGRKLSGI